MVRNVTTYSEELLFPNVWLESESSTKLRCDSLTALTKSG